MVIVGVLLGVGGRGAVAWGVAGRGRVGGVFSGEDGRSGLFPLGLFGVDVDVEPEDTKLVGAGVKRVKSAPFFVLFVPARCPARGDFGGFGWWRTNRGSVIVHQFATDAISLSQKA